MNEEINLILQCPVCLNVFNKPVCLDCGHVFCLECVLELQSCAKAQMERHGKCPYCRKNFVARKEFYWNVCMPIACLVAVHKEQEPKKIDFKFEIDLEDLTEEELKKIDI